MIRVDEFQNIQVTSGDEEVLTVDLVELPSREKRSLSSNEYLEMQVRLADSSSSSGYVLDGFVVRSSPGPTDHPELRILGDDTVSRSGRYVYDIQLVDSTSLKRTTVVGGSKDRLLEFYIVKDVR